DKILLDEIVIGHRIAGGRIRISERYDLALQIFDGLVPGVATHGDDGGIAGRAVLFLSRKDGAYLAIAGSPCGCICRGAHGCPFDLVGCERLYDAVIAASGEYLDFDAQRFFQILAEGLATRDAIS